MCLGREERAGGGLSLFFPCLWVFKNGERGSEYFFKTLQNFLLFIILEFHQIGEFIIPNMEGESPPPPLPKPLLPLSSNLPNKALENKKQGGAYI